jgi:signal transduction histidine kinase
LGDPEFDWLSLNKRRVQNPSRNIGSDQVIGYIQIQSEELSNLEEKAARDGLKENSAFERLKEIIQDTILPVLEIRRFEFRRNADAGRQKNRIESGISKLNPLKELGGEISRVLDNSNVSPEVATEVSKIIAEQDRLQELVVEDIQEAIAIYQGQATLGKIVNVVLHEGRKVVGHFVDICPLMQKWLPRLMKEPNEDLGKKFEDAISTSYFNAQMLDRFYKQLDPLASIQRGRKSSVSVKKAINTAFQTFQGEFDRNKIKFSLQCKNDVAVLCWPQDLQIIFTNLFENSIYWLANTASLGDKELRVSVTTENGNLSFIDIVDTGPGIEGKYIIKGMIFEPGFSTKPKGTGLGLALAGEAAGRCLLDLIALESDAGAHFRLAPKESEQEHV